MASSAIEVKLASAQPAHQRHLPVLAATAAAVVNRQVRLRKVAVLAAAAAAVNIAGGRGPRGRRIVQYRRETAVPWVTRGRVQVMTSHSPHLRQGQRA